MTILDIIFILFIFIQISTNLFILYVLSKLISEL
jgi:hypothetical protein